MSRTILTWALACCTRLSCSDWLMLVKIPASGLKCSTLPWRFVKKWPKLRMQHTRTTHWGKENILYYTCLILMHWKKHIFHVSRLVKNGMITTVPVKSIHHLSGFQWSVWVKVQTSEIIFDHDSLHKSNKMAKHSSVQYIYNGHINSLKLL